MPFEREGDGWSHAFDERQECVPEEMDAGRMGVVGAAREGD